MSSGPSSTPVPDALPNTPQREHSLRAVLLWLSLASLLPLVLLAAAFVWLEWGTERQALMHEMIPRPYLTFVPWLLAAFLPVAIAGHLAFRLRRRLAAPLAVLECVGEALQGGELPAIPPTRIKELDALIRALRRAAESAGALNADLEFRGTERTTSLEANSRLQEEISSALRVQEARLEALLENIPAIVFMKDLEGRFVLVNRHYEDVFGLRREDVVGKLTSDIFPEAIARVLRENDARVLAAGGPMENEEVVLQRGEPRTFLSIKFPLRDAEGRVNAMCGIATDITERKRAERELREALTFLRAILDSANYAIISTDTRGIIRTFNPAAERMLGYKAEELVGKVTPELFHEEAEFSERAAELERDYGERVETGFELLIGKARRQEVDENERVYVHKDGRRFPVVLSITALRDEQGEITGYLGIVYDITERKRIDEEMHAARARFEGILEIAADAIVSVDQAQRITLFNRGAEQTFGYRAEEVLGQPMDILLPEGFREAHRAHFVEFARSGEVTRRMDARAPVSGRRRDGSEFPAEASISKLELGGETVYTTMLRDVTERRRAEADIERLNRALERRASELEAVNRELESFSYSVSHDLRAPLRSIDGFSQVLLEDYAAQLDEEGCDCLRRVRAASQRMAQLIDDMLTLSRLSRAEMRRETVDLSGLARSVADELRAAEPGREVTVAIQEGVVASGDARLLRVVLENLLGNAWKYTSRHPRARVEFGTERRSDGTIVYFVRDDGAGFDMRYAGKLFGAFQRLHAESEFPGTGVGLSSVQRIVHRHGGEVWAEGVVEGGATFRFTLAEQAGSD